MSIEHGQPVVREHQAVGVHKAVALGDEQIGGLPVRGKIEYRARQVRLLVSNTVERRPPGREILPGTKAVEQHEQPVLGTGSVSTIGVDEAHECVRSERRPHEVNQTERVRGSWLHCGGD